MPYTVSSWEQYRQEELARLTPILTALGFVLDDVQPHIGGERSVISGKKLVLLGKRVADNKRVVIKASSKPEGRHEMTLEHTCRAVLDNMAFSYTAFLSPALLIWQDTQECLISITEFLEQDSSFLDRPLQEQFFLALKAFETQEGSHATTYEHLQMIRGTFRVFETKTYLENITRYAQEIQARLPDKKTLHSLIQRGQDALKRNHTRIEQYNGFLTHGDFVPHNVRIIGRDIYLLDHYDIRFGNKYDGWARFLNFMLLYHRELEQLLVQYVKDNRTPEESEALHLMRIYRLTELVWYYVKRLDKSTGDLLTLDEERISFWSDTLRAQLDHKPLDNERIQAYQNKRDSLRSEEEKQRQKGLH